MTTLSRPQAAAQPAPITGHRPRWPEALSAVIAALMTFASLGGLFIDGLYRDNTWSTAAYRGTDLATLLIAVPALAAALLLAPRGSDRARLVWLGVLAYNVYNYAFYLFGTAFNDFFLLYAALESLSLIALIGTAPAVLGQLSLPRASRHQHHRHRAAAVALHHRQACGDVTSVGCVRVFRPLAPRARTARCS